MAVWHPSPDTPPRGLLPDMSDKLKNPGPNGSGFSIRAAVFFPKRPRSCLIHVAKMHSSGKWGAKGLGANIETGNLLVLGASPQLMGWLSYSRLSFRFAPTAE